MSIASVLSAVENYLAAHLESVRNPEKSRHCATCTVRLCDAKATLIKTCRAGPAAPAGLRRILIAADHPHHPAIDAALTLARPLHAQIAVVYVVDTALPPLDESDYLQAQSMVQRRLEAESAVAEIRRRIPEDIPATLFQREGSPAGEIVDAATEWNADLIVIGTHRRGPLVRFFLGSVSRVVLRRANCPVLLIADAPASLAAQPADRLAIAQPLLA